MTPLNSSNTTTTKLATRATTTIRTRIKNPNSNRSNSNTSSAAICSIKSTPRPTALSSPSFAPPSSNSSTQVSQLEFTTQNMQVQFYDFVFMQTELLSLDDLDDERVIELLGKMNANCLAAFDQFRTNATAKATEATAASDQGTDEQETTTKPADDAAATEEATTATTTDADAQQATTSKSNAQLLVDTLTNWLEHNSNNNNSNNSDRGDADQYANGGGSGFNSSTAAARNVAGRPGPNEQKMREILERTGYSHEISSGQRKYGGPPPDWPTKSAGDNTPAATATAASDSDQAQGDAEAKTETDTATDGETSQQQQQQQEQKAAAAAAAAAAVALPPPGCECFVGKLPRDLFEDELIVVFEKQGRIWDLRLMIEPNTGFSKGYAFVTYCDKEAAKNAAALLNNYEIRAGKNIRVNISVANCKLFVGNIPKQKSKDELKQEFSQVVGAYTHLHLHLHLLIIRSFHFWLNFY